MRALESGLVDLRPTVVLWDSNDEVVRWHELQRMNEHKKKSDTEISMITHLDRIRSSYRMKTVYGLHFDRWRPCPPNYS